MAQKETHINGARKSSSLTPPPAEFPAIEEERIEKFVNIQTELFDKFLEIYRQWFYLAQSEANFAFGFASKLAFARSIPEVMETCQECISRQFEMIAEDVRRLLTITEKLTEAGARLMLNGSVANGGSGRGT